MALTAHSNRLQCFIHSMYDEFFQLQSMKEAIRRDYCVRAVTSFCVPCIRLFSNLIYQQEVNFHKVHVLARELYARTTGALRWCCMIHVAFRTQWEKGVVNSQFSAIVCPRNNGGQSRDHVIRVIETYLANVDVVLAELSHHVDNPQVDFCMLASLAREIEDKSTSIGAEHMRLACFDVIKACEERHKRRFDHTLTLLKNEFHYTRRMFLDYIQMEVRIMRIENSQAPPPS